MKWKCDLGDADEFRVVTSEEHSSNYVTEVHLKTLS
jgi:hypothetical protein